jgi:hypothetical protein
VIQTELILAQIVDKRSACLSSENVSIGCESVISVATDHINLPQFGLSSVPTDHINLPQLGPDSRSAAFTNYIQELARSVDVALAVKMQDFYGLDRRIKAEIHLFYDCVENDETYMKLWSVAPSLKTLFAFGPTKCLEQRKDSAKETLETPIEAPPGCPTTKPRCRAGNGDNNSQPSPSTEQPPSGSTRDSGDNESETSSTLTYQLPDISTPRFRWIHVPANNMFWVEKVIQAVELEREKHRLNVAVKGVEDRLATAPQAPTPKKYAKTTRYLIDDPGRATLDPLASHLQKALKSIQGKGEEPPVENLVEAVTSPKKAVKLLTTILTDKNERNTLNLAETALLAEDYGERARALEAAIPKDEGQPFNYFNDMREAVKDGRHERKLGDTLLHKRVWNSKQVEARHGIPHGRYMEPYCEIFFPKSAPLQHYTRTAAIPSPSDFPQMSLYVSPVASINISPNTTMLILTNSFPTSTGTLSAQSRPAISSLRPARRSQAQTQSTFLKTLCDSFPWST